MQNIMPAKTNDNLVNHKLKWKTEWNVEFALVTIHDKGKKNGWEYAKWFVGVLSLLRSLGLNIKSFTMSTYILSQMLTGIFQFINSVF